jgi:hypothetical protein
LESENATDDSATGVHAGAPTPGTRMGAALIAAQKEAPTSRPALWKTEMVDQSSGGNPRS